MCTRRSTGSLHIANQDGRTPLMVAASKGRQDIAKKLLTAGAFINLQVFVLQPIDSESGLVSQIAFGFSIFNRTLRTTLPLFWLAAMVTVKWLTSFSKSETKDLIPFVVSAI